eukprot:scaffold259744_cov45-Prasinocladus_malaysianus.AAC.1
MIDVAAGFDPYLGPGALPTSYYNITADVHIPMWVEDPAKAPSFSDGNAALVDVWKSVAADFGKELKDWLPKEWAFTAGEDLASAEVEKEEIADNNSHPPSINSSAAIAVSAFITFGEMDISMVTDAVRLAVLTELAHFNSVSLSDVLMISIVPGSAVWEMVVIFPPERAASVATYIATLRTNTPILF